MVWISVKDKMPELDTGVLAYYSKEDLIACCFTTIDNQSIKWNILSSGCGSCDYDQDVVTHWMPLPEKP